MTNEAKVNEERRVALAAMAQRDPMLAASTILLLEETIKGLKAELATYREELEALRVSQ